MPSSRRVRPAVAGGVLVAAWPRFPVGLDPHITSACSSFQVLQSARHAGNLDPDQNVIPHSPKAGRCPKICTSTFNLRDDIVFSNGRPMTAEDVVYTYTRLLAPETGSGNALPCSRA
ncbi:MAG: ABC transporter substrate-binding protein [Trueperaceae bacterium]|nr:ABC transporter substrate-binding protein [Trueperaceae bacterium]